MDVSQAAIDSAGRIRVLVADDHPVVRTGLAAVIAQEQDLLLVAEAEDGARAVALFREHQARRRRDGSANAADGWNPGDPYDHGGVSRRRGSSQ